MTYENLKKMFQSEDYRERYAAAENLARSMIRGWKGSQEEADELATIALRDPFWATRYKGAKFIYFRGKAATATIPALIEALKSEEPLVRNQCVLALQRTGGELTAFPALQQMLADGDQLDAVAAVLSELDPEGVEALRAAMGSGNNLVRLWSKAALATRGGQATAYQEELTLALENDPKATVISACKSAELAGPAAGAAGMQFANLLSNQDIDLRLAASKALRFAAPQDEAVVRILVSAMSDKEIQGNCCVALGRIGPKASSAVPDLVRLLEGDKGARYGVLSALERINPKAPEVLPVLIKVLQRSLDGRPDEQVIAAIGAYGPAAKAAVPDLIKALHVRGSHPYFIDTALWALGQIGPDAIEARDDVRRFIPGVFAETAQAALDRIEPKDPANPPPPEPKYTGRTLHVDF